MLKIAMVGMLLVGCDEARKQYREEYREETKKYAADFEEDINAKVTKDAVDQYEIAKRGGDKMDTCIHAGMATAAYLQAKNEPEYKRWKAIQKKDCKRAGMPSM